MLYAYACMLSSVRYVYDMRMWNIDASIFKNTVQIPAHRFTRVRSLLAAHQGVLDNGD